MEGGVSEKMGTNTSLKKKSKAEKECYMEFKFELNQKVR